MNTVVRVILIALCGILMINFSFGKHNAFSYAIELVSGICIFLLVIPQVSTVAAGIKELISGSDSIESIKIFFRCVIICEICSLAKSYCKDTSDSFLASCVDLAEKTAIIIVSMPLIESVIKLVKGYIGA